MESLRSYLLLIRSDPKFLAFGFLLTFCSSAGQTYFIGISGPSIMEAFSLSHTQWGTIYMVGTLMSAALLPWSGDLLDRTSLRRYMTAVVCGLAIACLVISRVNVTWMLIPAVFLLRQFGQGLTSHTAITSMARYMDKNRGKGIAISAMGYSFGEAILPLLAVIAISAMGWRQMWVVVAVCVLCFLPALLWLLGGHDTRHQNHLDSANRKADDGRDDGSRTRRQMLSESRFYLLLPGIMAPSYIGTALFFHHLTIAEAKGWSGIWITGNYWLYALCAIAASLGSGPLIDRFTAQRVIPYDLTPMMLGLLLLVVGNHPWLVIPYLVLVGLNVGVYFTASSAIWAELYGTRYLGGIKSLIGALGVFASALGPVTIGVMLDNGYTINQVCIFFAGFCAVSTAFLIAGLKRYRSDATESVG